MYSCPGCGSQMTFDIAGQQLKCGRCERTMSVIEADGLEGFDKAIELHPDIIITDIRMPQASGLDMIRDIEAYEPRKGGSVPGHAGAVL